MINNASEQAGTVLDSIPFLSNFDFNAMEPSASGGLDAAQIEDAILDSLNTNGSFSAGYNLDGEMDTVMQQSGDDVFKNGDVQFEQTGQGIANIYY